MVNEFRDPAVEGERIIYKHLKGFFSQLHIYLTGNSKNLRETIIALMLSVATDILTGIILGKIHETLILLPGLLVLIPAAINMRGSILAALGSRLGSGMHMGSIRKITLSNKKIQQNIYATFSLTILFSIFMGAAAYIIMAAFGLPSISIMELVLISFIGAMISTTVLLSAALFTAYMSYRHNWDLDNIQAPIITGLGDLVTVPAMLVGVFFLTPLKGLDAIISPAIIIVFFIALFMTWHSKSPLFRSIIAQSAVVVLLTGLAEIIFSGILLEQSLSKLAAIPLLLAIIPVFLEEGGNIGNTLASRLATKMHLGEIRSGFVQLRKLRNDIINSYLLAVIIFPVAAFLTFYVSAAVGIGGMTLMPFITLTFYTGLILTTIVIIFSIIVSMLAYRFQVDPDNVTIPMITTIADVLGVIVFLFVLATSGIV